MGRGVVAVPPALFRVLAVIALAVGQASLTPIALDRTDSLALSGFLASTKRN